MLRVKQFIFVLFFAISASVIAMDHNHEAIPLDKAPVNLNDKASLQRGAKYFVNYCLGCHSAEYMRYKRVAEDIGIVDENGKADVELMKLLMPAGASINDPITHAMPSESAKQWFGVIPPDLTLEARVRGVDWIYTYLRSFYKDDTRPWGVNNRLFKDVAMPHVLINEQGLQAPVFTEVEHHGQTIQQISEFQLVVPGKLSPESYDKMVGDLVNFLAYLGEPAKLERERMGVWVLLFLVVLFLFAWALKREMWKDVH